MSSITLEAGEHYLCSCGKSANFPFCDGSHKGTEFTPNRVELTETKELGLCGCKQSKNFPLCDGSHNNLK